MLSRPHREDHRAKVNWAPRSDVMEARIPKRAIQPLKRAAAESAAVVLLTGNALNYLEAGSMMVKRWENPPDGSKGPMRSMWRWANCRSGTGMASSSKCTCFCTLMRWHAKQERTLAVTSQARTGQTNMVETRRRLAWAQGWATLWMLSKTWGRSGTGTKGRKLPVEVSLMR